MFEFKILPRLSETDGVGHIHNTILPVWFEEARRDLFKIFNPELSLESWNLILRKYEIEFINQISHDKLVSIRTSIDKIGGKSIIVYQEAFQDIRLVASARTVLVYFDYSKGSPAEIPELIRKDLYQHLHSESTS
jgi:acyl-CoA thioester hydrolase